MIFVHLRKLVTTTALAISIAFSLGMAAPASAMTTAPMDGMGHDTASITNCINQHHVAPSASEKISPDDLEDDEPTPKPQPYYVQFQNTYTSVQQLAPTDIVRSSSFHPPDIIRLTGNIRF